MELSVVIPVYQGEETISELIKNLVKTLAELNFSSEIIAIDDGSNDNTWLHLKKSKSTYKQQLKIIRLSKNYGQHNATFCGLKVAKGRYIITMDDDFQHDPKHISKLLRKTQESDVDLLYAVPKNENYRAKFKNVGSNFWNRSTNNYDDGLGKGSSYRVIKSTLRDKVVAHNNDFVFLDEMFFWYTENIDFKHVDFNSTRKSKSTYSKGKLLKLGINLATNYSSLPLKFISLGGLVLSFIAFLIGVYFIVKKVVWGVKAPGYTSIMVAIFLTSSVILLALGVIGQYISKIYNKLNNKPTYSIREREL
jgi:undecaprenyl-phosphate 4-deoxy-4-formamido-L-arabinose transferase